MGVVRNRDGVWVMISGCLRIGFCRGQTSKDLQIQAVLPAHRWGYNYATELQLGSEQQQIINILMLDTGSSAIMVRDCANDYSRDYNGGCYSRTPTNNLSTHFGIWPCSELSFDSESVDFLGPLYSPCLDYAMLPLQSTSNISSPGWATLVNFTTVGNISASGTVHTKWEAAGGVMGMAQREFDHCATNEEELPAFQSLVQQVSPYRRMFAFDFRPPPDNGTVAIGGYSAEYANTLQWAERQVAEAPVYHTLRVYHMQACGAGIFSNITSNWDVLVDTGAVCLTLPADFFAALVSWLPLAASPCPTVNGVLICSVTPEVAARELPWLSFSLSETGPPIYIPLSALLLDEVDGAGNRQLCIRQGDDVYAGADSPALYNQNLPPIVFGARVLESLYVVFDMDERRVGLANKLDLNQSARAQGEQACTAPVVCVGMQKYLRDYNACEEPACHAYYFYRLDTETHECIPVAGIMAFGYTVAMILAVVEVSNYFLRQHLAASAGAVRGVQPGGWEQRAGQGVSWLLDLVPLALARLRGRRRHQE